MTKGVGIKALLGWNNATQSPIWKVMDALTWIPDPMVWFDANQARYHGFNVVMPMAEITKQKGYFNIGDIKETIDGQTQYAQSKIQLLFELAPIG